RRGRGGGGVWCERRGPAVGGGRGWGRRGTDGPLRQRRGRRRGDVPPFGGGLRHPDRGGGVPRQGGDRGGPEDAADLVPTVRLRGRSSRELPRSVRGRLPSRVRGVLPNAGRRGHADARAGGRPRDAPAGPRRQAKLAGAAARPGRRGHRRGPDVTQEPVRRWNVARLSSKKRTIGARSAGSSTAASSATQ